MSMADEKFKGMLIKILEEGTSTKNAKVRPIWADTNEPAYTKKLFGVVNEYDLTKEFPAGTLRKVPFKNCVQEMLWIWQKRSNKIKDLGLHIWDQWEGEDGTIGKAYGYQINKNMQKVKITSLDELEGLSCENRFYTHENTEFCREIAYSKEMVNGKRKYQSFPVQNLKLNEDSSDITEPIYIYMNQIDYVIHELKWNPQSRRIIANMYNIDELNDMNLHPCAYSMTFNVTEDEEGNQYLNAILNQRSLDTIVAGFWNVAQYAALVCLLAHCCDMKPGKLIHVIADAHIYDRHEEIAKELILRKEYAAPALEINKEKKNFFEFTADDIKLVGYRFGEPIKNIPVAK